MTLSLSTPWRHTREVHLQLHLFLTSALAGGAGAQRRSKTVFLPKLYFTSPLLAVGAESLQRAFHLSRFRVTDLLPKTYEECKCNVAESVNVITKWRRLSASKASAPESSKDRGRSGHRINRTPKRLHSQCTVMHKVRFMKAFFHTHSRDPNTHKSHDPLANPPQHEAERND